MAKEYLQKKINKTMTITNNVTTRPIDKSALIKRMAIGAGIAVILISLYLGGVEAEPEWGKFWIIRPIIFFITAGAGGGLFTYGMDYFLGYKGGWSKALAISLSLIGFIIALFIGFVLGFDGTLWN
jgi:hypothetical protein